MKELLCVLLNCGYDDVGILENTEYNLGEIARELNFEKIPVSLNTITDTIFIKGQNELSDAVGQVIENYKSKIKDFEENSDLYMELNDKIKELETLDPSSDMEWACDDIDTSCWLDYDKRKIYDKYLADTIKRIERNMGFDFL